MVLFSQFSFFFFFNDTAPPEISPLPLHAALPIYLATAAARAATTTLPIVFLSPADPAGTGPAPTIDRRGSIGRAHLPNPLPLASPLPPSAFKKKKEPAPVRVGAASSHPQLHAGRP